MPPVEDAELEKPSEQHLLEPPIDDKHYNFDSIGRRYGVDLDGEAIRRKKYWKPEEVPDAEWKKGIQGLHDR